MKRRRLLAWLLLAALFAGSLAGCEAKPPAPSDSGAAVTTQESSAASSETEAAPSLPEISWAKAFRTKQVPEGSVDAEHVAFLHRNGDGTMTVDNVPLEELRDKQPARLPRTRYFEQFIPDALVEELMPAVDYAMANGYSRLCIPTARFTYGDINAVSRYLLQTYSVNCDNIGALNISSFPRDAGEPLTFVLITIGGMEKGQLIDQYREAVAAAEAIVDGMPEELDAWGKMLYLYRWLTDNVRYDDNDYYLTQNWCLLYDALIRHSTVCAGYTEALYVLANLAGIDCFCVEGFVNTAEQSLGHIWNVAKLEGTYYQFDATWDEGLCPAEYRFFGVSSTYMLEHHTKYLVAFSEEYLPPCPASLLPQAVDPKSVADSPQGYRIFWYYRLLNARAYNPMQLFRYFGYEDETVNPGKPEVGWVTTALPLSDFFDDLTMLMTEQQAVLFLTAYFKNDRAGNLMYRVPEENPTAMRLCRLEENEDGSWNACLRVYSADGFVDRDDTIFFEEQDGSWYISDVR